MHPQYRKWGSPYAVLCHTPLRSKNLTFLRNTDNSRSKNETEAIPGHLRTRVRAWFEYQQCLLAGQCEPVPISIDLEFLQLPLYSLQETCFLHFKDLSMRISARDCCCWPETRARVLLLLTVPVTKRRTEEKGSAM